MPQNRDPQASGARSQSGRRRAVKRRRAVRRIPLKALEALSREEVAFGNRLLGLLPAPLAGERLLDELADEIERLVGLPHDVFFHTMRAYEGSEFSVRLDDFFVTTFQLAPDPDDAVLAADMNLIGSWLEAMLDDEPPEARTLPPPSQRDFGLVTFIGMQLVNWLSQRGLPPLSLPSAPPDLETVARRLRRQTEIAELVFAVTSRRAAGLVRLFVPLDLVRNMEVFVSKAAKSERRRKRLLMTRLGALHVYTQPSLGHLGLTHAELRGLGRGDLLLPSEHGLRHEELENHKGPGRLWLGASRRSYLPCTFHRADDGTWRIEITCAAPISPSEYGDEMSSEETGSKPSDEANTTQVLQQAEVDVEIRVGSMPLPVSMLAEIQSGYVLELERRVDEGVDLVVDARVVGRGELVNVDGRLGVRVLSIEE